MSRASGLATPFSARKKEPVLLRNGRIGRFAAAALSRLAAAGHRLAGKQKRAPRCSGRALPCDNSGCASVAEGKLTRVVLGAQPGRADGRNHGQKLLEGHLEVKEPSLAEHPAVVVENLVGNRNRELGKGTDRWERPRLSGLNRLEQANSGALGFVLYDAALPKWDYFAPNTATAAHGHRASSSYCQLPPPKSSTTSIVNHGVSRSSERSLDKPLPDSFLNRSLAPRRISNLDLTI